MIELAPSQERSHDLICLGRLAVDLYAQQRGTRLEDASSFAKYLGGSSGNVAFGAARLGLRTAMLTRVGDDHMGHFLLETLAKEGCDTSQVRIDPDRLTALVILGIQNSETFPLIFYRENCADMALRVGDIDEAFVASSRALAITGTHLSAPDVYAASSLALQYAHKHGVATVLDIDYRPVLWGLTSRGDGATRFIAAADVTAHLQAILPQFDVIVGTEEEFYIAGGTQTLAAALKTIRCLTSATLIIKHGASGCSVIDGAVPDDVSQAPHFPSIKVDVLNVVGAGDAFLASFFYGWLRGEEIERCCSYANACGAIVVSRHGCAPAMPNRTELEYLLTHAEQHQSEEFRSQLAHLHRVCVARPTWNDLRIFAFDHRSQFYDMARACQSDENRLAKLKSLLGKAVVRSQREQQLQREIGIICDSYYGQDALNTATGRGWWVGRPVELPGSNPLEFENGRSVGTLLQNWPQEHVVKCLIGFDPDAPHEQRIEQETQLLTLYQAVLASGHELLLEVIPPNLRGSTGEADATVIRALKRIYNLGIRPEWWKLAPLEEQGWQALDTLIDARDPWCRGVLLLGSNASFKHLARAFRAASQSRYCRGFAVGRSIFMGPARAWLLNEIGDHALVDEISSSFMKLASLWQEARDAHRLTSDKRGSHAG